MAIFQQGFRPFFLGAALFAGIALPLWIAALESGLTMPSHFAPRDWHIHEMVFGYFPAVLAGFLLTAIPNWTGRLPVAGPRLAALFALWLAGRGAIAISSVSPWGAALVDMAFPAALAALAWREVVAGKTLRNVPVCALVTLLAIADAGFDIAELTARETAPFERLGLGVAAMLIAVIGGRIVPSFTRNWLVKAGRAPLPAPFGVADKVAIVGLAAALLSWIAVPSSLVTGALFAIAAALHGARILRWSGWQTWSEPLVLILHLGYAWLPIWFALAAVSILAPGSLDASTALHALTAGAVATMTLAVMTRATLGHTGRALTANLPTVAIYGLVIAGAALRLFAHALPIDYLTVLGVAGSLWSAAFILFAIVYGPMLAGR